MKRNDMVALCDKFSVPQVFFNEHHVGGADDLLAVLETWDASNDSSTPLEKYQSTIASEPDPDDPRLEIPHTLPRSTTPPALRSEEEENFVKLPDGQTTTSVLKVMETLTGILDMQDRPYRATVYKQCFVNTEAVTAIQKHYGMKTRQQAVEFGRQLQELKILDHVCEDHVFKDEGYL
jgi:hypothetical protein